MKAKTVTLHFFDEEGFESYATREYETIREAKADMKEFKADKDFFNTRAESDDGWQSCIRMELRVNGEVHSDTFTDWHDEVTEEKRCK